MLAISWWSNDVFLNLVDDVEEDAVDNASKLENETKLPWWSADNGDHIMKVKSKHVGKWEQTLAKGGHYDAKLEFVYYDMVEKGIKGYYAKIKNIKLRVREEEDD